MLRYIGRRLLILIPILLAVIVIIFTINFCTPGSPAISILGGSATPEKLAEVEHEMGLDRPYFVQLGEYYGTSSRNLILEHHTASNGL